MAIAIASRTLEIADSDGSLVHISITQPEPDGNDFRCEFRILGLSEGDINSYGMGVDEVQALILSLQGVGTRLYTSDEGKQGRLRWLGMKNLGFPVPESISDLVPRA